MHHIKEERRKKEMTNETTQLTEDEQKELKELFADMLNCSRLTDWDIRFLNDIEGCFTQYGESTKISEKQWFYIRKIAAEKVYV